MVAANCIIPPFTGKTSFSTLLFITIFWQQAALAKAPLADKKQTASPPVEYITTYSTAGHDSGGGLIHPEDRTQSRSVLNRTYIDIRPPTDSAFQLASMLPGANVANSDPFGISPQTNITIRGLNGDAIGYVMEGMPLNDIAYYGGYPGQFADTENYSEIALQQGSADLDSPVLNAAGGLMTLSMRDPALKRGGYASFSYGSYNTRRGFVRFDTGEIGHSGIRGFVSYSNTHGDNWRGAGYDTRQHIDFKFLKEWGNANHVGLLGSWNRAMTSYYPKVSLAQWKKGGIHAKNLSEHYNPSDKAGGTDYWRLWRDPEETFYFGAPMRLTLSRHLFLTATAYGQDVYGNAPSGTTLDTTGNYQGTSPVSTPLDLPYARNGTAIMRADYTQRSYRGGLNSALHLKNDFHLPNGHSGQNELIFGYWYDYSDDNEQQPFANVDPRGHAPDIWGEKARDHIRLEDGQRLLGGSFHTMAQVNALFIGDHMSLFNNRLVLDAGFKEVMLSRWGNNDMPGPQHHVSSNTSEPLPRFGLRWSFTSKDQIFLNGTTNFRAPAVTAYYNSYGLTTPDIVGLGTTRLKNEYSIAEEFGYRRNGKWLTGSVTFFNYNFTNRQVATIIDNHGLQIASTLNAGGQTSRGVDGEFGTKPLLVGNFLGARHFLSPYLSFEYLHATIDNDLPVGDDILPTKGKTSVRSPHFMGAVGLRYHAMLQEDSMIFGMITAHYTGTQYSSFMNDEKMPGYATADLSLGYRFANSRFLHHPNIQLNFLNISNQHYLSGISSTPLNSRTIRGRHGTMIAGETTKYRVGGGFAALFTASAGF